MAEFATTLGQHWMDHYLCGMILLHTILGYNVDITPKVEPTPAIFVGVLQDIVSGKYKPSTYFNSGKTPQISLVVQPPTLTTGQQYVMINLNVSTSRSQFVSVVDGGILYEDPVWAILAAHAIANKILVALPIAKDYQVLWEKKSSLTQVIKEGKYKPQDFFGAVTGFIPSDSSAKFDLVRLESTKINALRDRGMQSVKILDALRFVELFQTPLLNKDK